MFKVNNAIAGWVVKPLYSGQDSFAFIRKFVESDDKIRDMWNVGDVVCWECEMLGLWDIGDVGC